jgi:predicted nucleic-acid-binding Zn-ribbon protein
MYISLRLDDALALSHVPNDVQEAADWGFEVLGRIANSNPFIWECGENGTSVRCPFCSVRLEYSFDTALSDEIENPSVHHNGCLWRMAKEALERMREALNIEEEELRPLMLFSDELGRARCPRCGAANLVVHGARKFVGTLSPDNRQYGSLGVTASIDEETAEFTESFHMLYCHSCSYSHEFFPGQQVMFYRADDIQEG